ncbi:MAG: hypothetical protein RR048_01810 [Oscillospiraceae bacterium]
MSVGAFAVAEENIQPRFPGMSGLYSVTVYPTERVGAPTYFASGTQNTGMGRDQQLNVTLSNATRTVYERNNCTAYYVAVDVNFNTATKYELYINDRLSETGSCMGVGRGTMRFFVETQYPSTWKIVLYDNKTPYQGLPLHGTINYR